MFPITPRAYIEHEKAKAELKSLVPEDAKEATGHGVRAKRSKSGAISFDCSIGNTAMQRSSKSIGTIAAALAKAQAEIINPEKSLVATIRRMALAGPNGRSAMRRCRAASISCAKLSQHEIATVQTTAIDQTAGIVNLTTCWLIRRENGSHRIGQFAPSVRPRRRTDGSSADLCSALCPIHPGWHCRGGRHRCPRSQSADGPAVGS